jgi:hypothetical protein
MKHFHFFLGLMTSVLLLSACQSSQSKVVGDPFSSHEAFCKGRMAWSAEVTTDDVVYTTFWIAFDAATVQDHFKRVHVDVAMDGQSVTEEMKYLQVPEPYSVTCMESGQQFAANRVKYTLLLPSVSKGVHVIRWTYTITSDLDDGVFKYPSGTTAESVITINVEQLRPFQPGM